MKKIFTLLMLSSLMILQINAQVLNPGFEQWTLGNPDNWFTSNILPVMTPVTQTTDAHSGDFAVKGEVFYFMNAPIGPILQSGNNAAGFPVSIQYHSFEAWYKFEPIGGDMIGFNIALTKNGETIAQGAMAPSEPVSQYTRITVPITYTVNETPDNAIIQISIVPPSGSELNAGSIMYIDDVALSTSTGIDEPTEGMISCYPNPASAFVNIPLPDVSGGIMIAVYDSRGKEIYSTTTDPEQKIVRIPVANLVPGLYYYSVKEDNKFLKGKFSVSR